MIPEVIIITYQRDLCIWINWEMLPKNCNVRFNCLMFFFFFSRGHSSVHLAVSVGRSVRPSVRPSHFWIPSGFRITAPAQLSATGLPCIRPCFFSSPHVPENKWHSQKKWIFRFSLGGYPEMCANCCHQNALLLKTPSFFHSLLLTFIILLTKSPQFTLNKLTKDVNRDWGHSLSRSMLSTWR